MAGYSSVHTSGGTYDRRLTGNVPYKRTYLLIAVSVFEVVGHFGSKYVEADGDVCYYQPLLI